MNFVESVDMELKEVVAFANTHGGTIYIGVSDDGAIIGLETPDKVLLQAVNVIRDSIKPDVPCLLIVL